jgi:hypothetical protein
MARLKTALDELGPADFIDVQSFMWRSMHLLKTAEVRGEETLHIVGVWVIRVDPAQLGDSDSAAFSLKRTGVFRPLSSVAIS